MCYFLLANANLNLTRSCECSEILSPLFLLHFYFCYLSIKDISPDSTDKDIITKHKPCVLWSNFLGYYHTCPPPRGQAQVWHVCYCFIEAVRDTQTGWHTDTTAVTKLPSLFVSNLAPNFGVVSGFLLCSGWCQQLNYFQRRYKVRQKLF